MHETDPLVTHWFVFDYITRIPSLSLTPVLFLALPPRAAKVRLSGYKHVQVSEPPGMPRASEDKSHCNSEVGAGSACGKHV